MELFERKFEDDRLRSQAVALIKQKPLPVDLDASTVAMQRLVHELEVHQVELEIQNAELVEARAEAITARKHYVDLFDFAPIGYLSLARDASIVKSNFSAAQLLGKIRSDLIGKRFNPFVSVFHRQFFSDFVEDVFESEVKETCELVLAIENQPPVCVFLTGIMDSSREFCLVALIDITERKRAEKALLIAKQKAEESERLKTVFLQNIGHEIRTPMNAVLGFTQILKNGNMTAQELNAYLDVILDSGKQLLDIVEEVTVLSKIDAGKLNVYKTRFELKNLVHYLCEIFHPEAEAKGIKLLFEDPYPDEQVFVVTDREHVFAILVNLVKNAIKFTNEGSVDIGYKVTEEMITFSVVDTGSGIPPENRDLIFERFRQGEESLARSHGGIGLGLSIVKAYTEELNGTIWLESEVGKGSTFYFSIPNDLHAEIAPESEILDTGSECETRAHDLKVLIAESDSLAQKRAIDLVKDISRKTLVARNVEEILEISQNHSDIDLILMDIELPGMSVFDAIRKIRSENDQVAIIAQSDLGLSGEKIDVWETGCDDILAKPTDHETLYRSINRVLRKMQLRL